MYQCVLTLYLYLVFNILFKQAVLVVIFKFKMLNLRSILYCCSAKVKKNSTQRIRQNGTVRATADMRNMFG